jgi:hypothetical protein
MERMPDGRSETWAHWKNDVLGLPDEKIDEYLAQSEGYTPERIAEFRASGSAIVPSDWETSEEAARAVSRLFAYRDALRIDRTHDAPDEQGERGAALPPKHDAPQREADAPSADDGASVPPSADGSPRAVESNASDYGAAAESATQGR